MPKSSKSRRAKSRGASAPSAHKVSPGETSAGLASLLEALPLAGFVALSIATCLVPSETPPSFGLEIPLVMGWLLLLAAWALLGMIGRKLTLRFDWVSLALLIFFLWLCLSSAVNLSDSRPRATLNMTFRWLSFAVMFFLARQLFSGARDRRAMLSVMLAVATGIAALGIYNYAVTNPASRARYEADPQQAMLDAGINAPLDSPVGRQFRDRVYSLEPQATFALTNSLAGFLTPWLLVMIGLAWQAAGRLSAASSWRSARLIVPLIGMLVSLPMMLFCLLLTKSRSAWGAVALGLALLLGGAVLSGMRACWKWLLGGAALAVGMVVAAVSVGGVDREVISEALKSFTFRLQYWQATASMIADDWLTGIGVGNFQQQYAAYKLPAASEMIGDPHNFLLEVAASMGLPALLPLGAALLLVMRYAMPRRLEATEQAVDAPTEPSCLPIYLGVALGFLLAVPLQIMTAGPSPLILNVLLVVAPTTGLVLSMLSGWVSGGRLPRGAMAVGLLALLVNLLAAGGISFASVSLPIWLLAALLVTSARNQGDTSASNWFGQRQLSGSAALAAVAACLLPLAMFYWLAYRPVLNSRVALQSAEVLLEQGHYATADDLLREAVAADPLNDVAYRRLALAAQRQWLKNQREALFRQFETMAAEAIRLNPHSHRLRAELSQRYLEAYRASGAGELLGQAIEHQRAAVTRYPHDSLGHAQLAWLLSVAQQPTEAKQQAKRALELDAINPHADRELATQKLFDTQGKLPADESALETVQRLAN